MIGLIRWMVRQGWPFRVLNPLFGQYNPFHPDYARDPYPFYRRLREHAPVYRHPVLRAWVLSRHADVSAVLKDPRSSVRRLQLEMPAALNPFRKLDERFVEGTAASLLMLDPPDHTRIRTLVGKAFTPRRIEALRPRIQQIVDGALDRLDVDGPIDLIRDFAIPVPIQVIAELLGVPTDDRELFKSWSSRLVALLDPFSSDGTIADAGTAFQELDVYFTRLFAERRRAPRDDLISALVAASEQGDRLSEIELLSTVFLILGAGHETTTNLIGNATVAMIRHPGERKRLQDDFGLIETAVDEFLRFDSPVQATDRILGTDLEIDGHAMKEGQLALLLLGGANRDPAVFAEPDRLDLSRVENPHLSFSQGAHFCLGAQLARAEAQIALRSLLARFPDWRGDGRSIDWRSGLVLRGPRALSIHLT
jgi:cytochrome P450